MAATHALDNDVVLKLAYYGLLNHLLDELSAHAECAVLGTAKFVIRDRVTRDGVSHDVASTLSVLNQFLSLVEHLEPSPPEVHLATQLEDAAMREHLELDAGESLLCSILIHRSMHRLLTGDKRAIQSIEALFAQIADLEFLRFRVASLEQVIGSLNGRLGPEIIRSAVCSAKAADTALALCFSCSSPEVDSGSCIEGLTSYVEHLRLLAPNVLVNGLTARDI